MIEMFSEAEGSEIYVSNKYPRKILLKCQNLIIFCVKI